MRMATVMMGLSVPSLFRKAGWPNAITLSNFQKDKCFVYKSEPKQSIARYRNDFEEIPNRQGFHQATQNCLHPVPSKKVTDKQVL